MLGDERVSTAYARNAEFWIDIVRDRLDPYQTQLTDPALLAAVGDCTGLDVLDAGCGEGYLTRELVRRGAGRVHGVDTCAEFVTAASTHPEHTADTATFHHADVAQLPLPDRSIDLVIANRLPNGITDPQGRFREFARVLRPDGRLLTLGMHPCFYAARAERDSTTAQFAIDDYFGTRTVEQRFQVAGRTSPAASVQSFFSLEASIAMITEAGFAITALREPRPTAEQRRENPWWDRHFQRPLFLLLEARPWPRP